MSKGKTQEQSTLSLVSETDVEVANILGPVPLPEKHATPSSVAAAVYSPEAEIPEEELDTEGTTTDDAETPRIAIKPPSGASRVFYS